MSGWKIGYFKQIQIPVRCKRLLANRACFYHQGVQQKTILKLINFKLYVLNVLKDFLQDAAIQRFLHSAHQRERNHHCP